jgi:hypothetical protein
MTMEEIFRCTISSSINHQAVFEFESVQLELKQFGRLTVHDASVYVKPQFVDVSGDDTIMKFMVGGRGGATTAAGRRKANGEGVVDCLESDRKQSLKSEAYMGSNISCRFPFGGPERTGAKEQR